MSRVITPLECLTVDAVRHIESTVGEGSVRPELGHMLLSQFDHMLDVLADGGFLITRHPLGAPVPRMIEGPTGG